MSKKVLLIEDDPDQIFLYKTAFDIGKIENLAANGGEIGLNMAKEKKPDVIVLDLVMEGMDGEEVIRRLKADPDTKNIPVIVFTNLDKKQIKEKFIGLGAAEFWGKTQMIPSELVKKVKSYLGE